MKWEGLYSIYNYIQKKKKKGQMLYSNEKMEECNCISIWERGDAVTYPKTINREGDIRFTLERGRQHYIQIMKSKGNIIVFTFQNKTAKMPLHFHHKETRRYSINN